MSKSDEASTTNRFCEIEHLDCLNIVHRNVLLRRIIVAENTTHKTAFISRHVFVSVVYSIGAAYMQRLKYVFISEAIPDHQVSQLNVRILYKYATFIPV